MPPDLLNVLTAEREFAHDCIRPVGAVLQFCFLSLMFGNHCGHCLAVTINILVNQLADLLAYGQGQFLLCLFGRLIKSVDGGVDCILNLTPNRSLQLWKGWAKQKIPKLQDWIVRQLFVNTC